MPVAREIRRSLPFPSAWRVLSRRCGERKKDKEKTSSGAGDQRRALHALNRLTFGPRPGDVQRVNGEVSKMDRPTTASRKIDR